MSEKGVLLWTDVRSVVNLREFSALILPKEYLKPDRKVLVQIYKEGHNLVIVVKSKIETYRGHEIFEDDEVWVVKGPVVNDRLPWEFFSTLADVKGWIDDMIEYQEGRS